MTRTGRHGSEAPGARLCRHYPARRGEQRGSLGVLLAGAPNSGAEGVGGNAQQWMPNWIGETLRLIPVNATGDSGREHGTEGPLCPEEGRRGSHCGSRAPAGQGPEAGGQDTHVSGFDWEIWGSIKLQCK